MNICVGTHSFPWAFGSKDPDLAMTIEQLLEKAVEYRCSGVQIADNYPLQDLSPAQLDSLVEDAKRKKLRLEVGVRGLIPAQVLAYLGIAKHIGAPFLRVVIDLHEVFQPSKDEVVSIVNDLLPHFESAGVILAIENHDRFAAKDLADIVEKTSEKWVGICLDTANSIGAGEGINEVLHHLAKYTVNLHIKDLIFGRLSHNMGFIIQGTPAGKGTLDIPHIVREVDQYGKTDTMLVEVWSDQLESEQRTIEREERWARQSVEYLKQFQSDNVE